MSDNSWAYDLGTVVFSIVKAKAKPKLESKYPTIYFTSNGKKLSDAIFPTVYIHRMAAAERGADLSKIALYFGCPSLATTTATVTISRIRIRGRNVIRRYRHRVDSSNQFRCLRVLICRDISVLR